jgi:hypothetical protein
MTVAMIAYLQNKFTEITVASEKTIEESLLVQNKVLGVKRLKMIIIKFMQRIRTQETKLKLHKI